MSASECYSLMIGYYIEKRKKFDIHNMTAQLFGIYTIDTYSSYNRNHLSIHTNSYVICFYKQDGMGLNAPKVTKHHMDSLLHMLLHMTLP